MTNKRLNIGLLTGDIRDVYTNELTKGAMNAAEELDCNLLVVPGRYYSIDPNILLGQYEYQYQSLFSYFSEHNVDVIIACIAVIGTYQPGDGRDGLNRFLSKFEGTPVVTISCKVPEWPNLKFDNASGLKEGIKNMIMSQKCKRIAMITGIENNDDSTERLNAYREALEENGIEYDESLVKYGDFTSKSEMLVIDLLHEHPDIDGIVFGNDQMAFGGYVAAKMMGIKVGEDIAFLGYDDIENCTSQNPPLASVRADASILGYNAVVKAKAFVENGDREDVLLPTTAILRESIYRGNTNNHFIDILGDDTFSENTDFEKMIKDTYDYILVQHTAKYRNLELFEQYSRLWKSIESLVNNTCSASEAMSTLINDSVNFLSTDRQMEIDIAKLLRVAESVEGILRKSDFDDHVMLDISNGFSVLYRKIASRMEQHRGLEKLANKHIQHNISLVTFNMVSFETGSEREYASIMEHFHNLGIEHSMLYTFEEPIMNLYEDDFKAPEYMYLKAVQNGAAVRSVANHNQIIKTSELFQDAFSYSERRMNLVMLNLYINEYLYGFILCDIPYDMFGYYEFLIYQASAATKLIKLMRESEASQRMLEESISIIKQNNIKLETLSKSDELTGGFNRRGFMTTAEEIISDAANIGKYIIVIFADLDNLKIINDRYGHDEGDFALASSYCMLRNVLGDEATIGRIGGDEFTAILTTDKVITEDELKDAFENEMKMLNDTSEKDYLVRISFGMTTFECKPDLDLKEMLDIADEKLYVMKKHRKKEVARIKSN